MRWFYEKYAGTETCYKSEMKWKKKKLGYILIVHIFIFLKY